VIFANWRGFSGGTRDMFAEVLKYGAMIVDALVDYRHPVTIYIPPNGELRGGSWVVLDPKINPDHMEMFADVESRGGILEPPAAAEIVFKNAQIIEMMHRTDDTLRTLDADKAGGKDVNALIKAREKLLMPVYRQVAVTYCDLHDRSGRMKGLGAIREELQWRNSRAYLHWRIRRRQQEGFATRKLRQAVPSLGQAEAATIIGNFLASVELDGTDRAVAHWFEENQKRVEAFIEEERQRATKEQIFKLFATLSGSKQADVARDLVGYIRVSSCANGRVGPDLNLGA
jgi:acetyl-CoA carboxylase/biotin carboxylase 1